MRTLLLTTLLLLSGCELDLDLPFPHMDVEKAKIAIFIGAKGAGQATITFSGITSREGGEQGQERLKQLIHDFETTDDYNFLKEYAFTHITKQTSRDEDGKLSVSIEGRYEDVFTLMKFLDSSIC